MPTEPPFVPGAFTGDWAEPWSDAQSINQLYSWQKSETADSPYGQAQYDPYSSQQSFDGTTSYSGGGQGQYDVYGSLTQAERDRIETAQNRSAWGFDWGYGASEDSERDLMPGK